MKRSLIVVIAIGIETVILACGMMIGAQTGTKGKADPRTFDDYVGGYALPQFQRTLVVTRDGDKLFGQPSGGTGAEMKPEDDGSFSVTNESFKVRFVRDETGMVVELAVILPSGQEMRGKKAMPSAKATAAAKGYTAFRMVIAGDPSKWNDAIQNLEDAASSDPRNMFNLYTLARAYFYDGITNNRTESFSTAKTIFEKVLAQEPNYSESLSFHGSILVRLSQGQDSDQFMKGAQEMNRAVEMDSENIGNRIGRAVTAANLPSQAWTGTGNYDPLKDFEMLRDFADRQMTAGGMPGAPHAQVVLHALVGESLLKRGEQEKALVEFEKALALSPPSESAAKAGRSAVNDAIRDRMKGKASSFLGSCYSCHLTTPEKLPMK